MKKPEISNKTYISLSKKESELLNSVAQMAAFSVPDIKKLTGWRPYTINNALSSLAKKGAVVRIKGGVYSVYTKIPENLFAIANKITYPSYIGFWTAFSYYGCTEQQLRAIQVVSTRQHPSRKVLGHLLEVTAFKPSRFYGYTRERGFSIGEIEKIVIDSLYKPDKVGGINELTKCLKNAWPKVNQRKLYAYARNFGIKSVFSRLGYILGELNLKTEIMEKLRRNLPSGFVKLNPEKKTTNKYSREWMVMINDW